MDRDEFLTRVRTAGATTTNRPVTDLAPGPFVPDLPVADLTERFLERLDAVNGVGHVASSTDEVVRVVSDLIEGYGAGSALTTGDLPVPDLLARLGLAAVDTTVPPEERLRHQASYQDAVLGITGAAGGLAESGTIVLTSGPGRARMASLIPLVHIALLRESEIVPSLSHWIADHPSAARDSANLVFITGPSRTADIEQILNLGVHGPKHLHVVVW